MPTSQTVFATWLRTRIAPRLRERGLAGSGQDFHRRVERNWQVVNVQRSAWGSADETTFTINLGTASSAVMVAAGVDPDVPPREYECHWRTRIGGLMPGDKDTWWTVRSTTDERALDLMAVEVGAALLERGLPELDRRVSDASILTHVLPDDSEMRALDIVGPLLLELGPPERFAGYMAILDASLPEIERYTIFDHMARQMGPARTTKALERVHRRGWEPRQQALIDLAHAQPTSDVLTAVTMALEDSVEHVRMAAAYAVGKLGSIESLDALLAMVTSAPRQTASYAAIACVRLADRLNAADLERVTAAIRARHSDAVGHERPLLGHLLRDLGAT